MDKTNFTSLPSRRGLTANCGRYKTPLQEGDPDG